MSDIRVALRLVARGDGTAARLTLMIIGFAFGVLILLFVATVPSVLDERGRKTADREVLGVTESQAPRYWAQPIFGSWNGRKFTRVFVAGSEDSPLPPGLSRFPASGEAFLSPAAARLVAATPEAAQLVPGVVKGTIGPPGLLGPDELYAYVGVDRSELRNAIPGLGWGGHHSDQEVKDQFSDIPLQLLLIVSAPIVIYFVVCARLSAVSRRRRYAALHLVGLSKRRIVRMALLEAVITGACGVVLGLTAYHFLNRILGPSGAAGFGWYPDASRVTVGLASVVSLFGVTMSVIVSTTGTRWALSKSIEVRKDSSERPPRWSHAFPFALGLGLIAYPLIASDIGPRRVMDPVSGWLLIAGVGLSVVGLLFALRPVLVSMARFVGGSRAPLPLRVAARRVEAESSGLLWHLAGVCTLVLAASVGAGVLRQAELAASPGGGPMTVRVLGVDLQESAKAKALSIPANLHWFEHASLTEPPQGRAPTTIEDYVRYGGVRLTVISCGDLRTMSGSGLADCEDGRLYRSSGVGGLPAGVPVKFLRSDGSVVELETPRLELRLPPNRFSGGFSLIYTSNETPLGIGPDTRIFFELSPGIAELDRFAVALTRIAPAASLVAEDIDLNSLEVYRVHRGVLINGISLAFVLSLSAFMISLVARAVERRRDISTLVVVGARPALLRGIQMWQTIVPLALALLLSALVGHLAGNALLKLEGQQSGWYLGTLDAAWPLMTVGALTAIAASTIVFGLRPRAEELRRE